MTQVEVQKLQLQINTNWEATTMANQVNVKLYDQLIEESSIELGEALEKVKGCKWDNMNRTRLLLGLLLVKYFKENSLKNLQKILQNFK